MARAAETNRNADVPLEPILVSSAGGWTNVIRLGNEHIEVIVAPEIGRILQVSRPGGRNLYRENTELAGKLPPADDDGRWSNYGGDWIWPVAQTRWSEFQPGNWPPRRLLDGRPWEYTSWKTLGGQQCCLMSQHYGAPLHLKASRLIKLEAGAKRLLIAQRLERTAASTVPVTLWQISQVAGAARLVLPVDDNSAFTNGYRVLMFAAPPAAAVQVARQTLVLRTELPAETKLGSDSRQGWVAAQVDRAVILLEVITPAAAGPFPEEGCAIEVYTNPGMDYSEIELLSPEVNLAPGAVLETTVALSVHMLPRGTAPSALPAWIQRWRSGAGENALRD